jgi:membrane protease YdiL (CAAX protease family)
LDDRQVRELQWTAIGYASTALLALVLVGVIWFATPALRRRWLPLPRLRPGTWMGHEVFLSFCVYRGFPSLVLGLLLALGFFGPLLGPTPSLDPPDPDLPSYSLRCHLVSSPLILAVTLAILFAMLFARSRTRPHQFGLTWSRWLANVALGLAVFLVATPLALLVYYCACLVVSWFVPLRSHPLTALGQTQLAEWEWWFIAFEATVAAPILEEIVFRGILQGWLRRATLSGHLGVVVATVLVSMLGVWYDEPGKGLLVVDPNPVVFAFLMAGAYAYRMYRLARRFEMSEGEIQDWMPAARSGSARIDVLQSDLDLRREWGSANAVLAVHGSAMLFAAFHSDSWPAPIALFVLGLFLGELARRTQSILGPITLHAAFNLVAFIGLYGMAHYDAAANGNEQTTAVRPALAGSTVSSVPASHEPLRK